MKWQRYSAPARRAIFIAKKQATDARTNLVRPVHIALGCVAVDGNVRDLLGKMNRLAIIEDLLIDLSFKVSPQPNEPYEVTFSPIAMSCLDSAGEVGRLRGRRKLGLLRSQNYQIETLDLLVGSMDKSVQMAAAFKEHQLSMRDFSQMADWMPLEANEDSVPTPRPRSTSIFSLGRR